MEDFQNAHMYSIHSKSFILLNQQIINKTVTILNASRIS